MKTSKSHFWKQSQSTSKLKLWDSFKKITCNNQRSRCRYTMTKSCVCEIVILAVAPAATIGRIYIWYSALLLLLKNPVGLRDDCLQFSIFRFDSAKLIICFELMNFNYKFNIQECSILSEFFDTRKWAEFSLNYAFCYQYQDSFSPFFHFWTCQIFGFFRIFGSMYFLEFFKNCWNSVNIFETFGILGTFSIFGTIWIFGTFCIFGTFGISVTLGTFGTLELLELLFFF